MPAPQRKPKQMVSIANDAIYANEEEEIPFVDLSKSEEE